MAWTNSRVVGSPDPPLPYTVEKVFTHIRFRAPLFAIREPGTDALWVVQQGGEKDRPSKVLRVREAADQAETLLTISNRLVYSVEFHPGFRTNRHVYLFSNGPTQPNERTNRISRFTLGKESLEAESVIIEWRSAGHDGGGMAFGREGMFYISTGDGTSDSDEWNSGQTIDDLLGGVLRIDVNRPEDGKLYSVPKDNPFVGWTNARPELWAYGLRNPWRMTVDQKTGHLWVGNNGQDLWETIHLVRRGENYGWSVYEGSHPFYLNRKLGPTPAVKPTIEHHHAEARSLTGGVVYYGERLRELEGAYVYGDYSSGTIWGARHDGSRIRWHKELARTELQIAAFAVDHRGELLIVDHGGFLYRMISAPQQIATNQFPTRLSETGIFASTKDHHLDPGLIPYSVHTAGWANGAQVERFLGLPNDTKIELSNGWTFPNGAVLVQTLSLPLGEGAGAKRIETRLLTRQTGQWVGYSYRWNESQTDATLVGARGEDHEVVTRDGRQTWRIPARAECMACHSRAANFVLGFTELQLNKTHDYEGTRDEQLRTLQHIGVFNKTKPFTTKSKLVDAYDAAQDLEARARSYLHVNCSVCHVEAGGGNARMELGFNTKAAKMNVFEQRPQHDTFGIHNAMLVAPGDPERSVLYQRVSRRGRGQMPPVASPAVDHRAVELIAEWIRRMKPTQPFVREWTMEDFLPKLGELKQGRSVDSGGKAFRDAGCNQCHTLAGEGGIVGPDLTHVGQRLSPRDVLESILLPSKVLSPGYENAAISNMPTGLVNTLDENQVLDLLAFLLNGN